VLSQDPERSLDYGSLSLKKITKETRNQLGSN
jgi:hypothetical protein